MAGKIRYGTIAMGVDFLIALAKAPTSKYAVLDGVDDNARAVVILTKVKALGVTSLPDDRVEWNDETDDVRLRASD